jgi:hypothetical protein
MPNNKRPVSLFKGQNKGENSPKSGIQNVAMSPYNTLIPQHYNLTLFISS